MDNKWHLKLIVGGREKQYENKLKELSLVQLTKCLFDLCYKTLASRYQFRQFYLLWDIHWSSRSPPIDNSISWMRRWRPIIFCCNWVFSCFSYPIWLCNFTFSAFCPAKFLFSSSSTLMPNKWQWVREWVGGWVTYLWASTWRVLRTSMDLWLRTFSSYSFSCLSICTSLLLYAMSSLTVLIISYSQQHIINWLI